MKRHGAIIMAAGLTLGAVAAAALPAFAAPGAGSPPPSAATQATASAAPATSSVATWVTTTADLRAARAKRVLFGHQSVGANILGGVVDLYRARGLTPPRMRYWSNSLGASGAYFADLGIGWNGNPISKIDAFARAIKGGAGVRANVAAMKLCYVDVTAGTNVTDLYVRYRAVMTRLKALYPRVVFIHVTVPLTTSDAADNAARQRFNALLRSGYGATGRLFDLAAVESTTPTGARVTGTYRGVRYYALYSGYSSDGGHLNTAGAKRAADAFLRVIARAVP